MALSGNIQEKFQSQGNKIGPILLSPGVTRREIFVFLICISVASAMVSFCALLQPFIFTEILHIPIHSQGRVGGMLSSVQQLMFLIFISFAGALADRWGRKIMLLLALAGFAICAFLFPLVSSLTTLVMVRLLFGLAQNGHTAGAPVKAFDYPDNASRGKFMALFMLVLNLSSIILVGLIGSRVPDWLRQSGFSNEMAGRYAFWIVATIAALTALLCAFGLDRDRPAHPASTTSGGIRTILSGFRQVYDHALKNRAFGLLMITGFVIRADITVLQSFVALWVVNAGHTAGLTTTEALKIAGTLGAIQSTCFLVIPLVFGVFLDRFHRAYLYMGSIALSGIALSSFTMVHNVTAWPIYVAMAAVGATEAAQTITQQALFGQEAPAHLRGTAYGVFACTGTLSVVIMTALGGILFDRIGYTAPFALAGGLHFVVLIISVIFMATRKDDRSPSASA